MCKKSYKHGSVLVLLPPPPLFFATFAIPKIHPFDAQTVVFDSALQDAKALMVCWNEGKAHANYPTAKLSSNPLGAIAVALGLFGLFSIPEFHVGGALLADLSNIFTSVRSMFSNNLFPEYLSMLGSKFEALLGVVFGPMLGAVSEENASAAITAGVQMKGKYSGYVVRILRAL